MFFRDPLVKDGFPPKKSLLPSTCNILRAKCWTRFPALAAPLASSPRLHVPQRPEKLRHPQRLWPGAFEAPPFKRSYRGHYQPLKNQTSGDVVNWGFKLSPQQGVCLDGDGHYLPTQTYIMHYYMREIPQNPYLYQV